MSDYWLRLKTTYNLPSKPTDEQGRSKVFHSLRRVVINNLRDSGVGISHIQSLIGHEPTTLGETARYLDELPLETLLTDINKLKVKGIHWCNYEVKH